MNSKEALEEYKKIYVDKTLKFKEQPTQEWYLNIIKQDLEVLEIIKKHLTICGLSISCFIGGNPNVKETYEPKFKNLKEWLENEK